MATSLSQRLVPARYGKRKGEPHMAQIRIDPERNKGTSPKKRREQSEICHTTWIENSPSGYS